MNVLSLSHPVWVRGLKLSLGRHYFFHQLVAPRVGAWIETPHTVKNHIKSVSHPVWVRGLKLPDRRG